MMNQGRRVQKWVCRSGQSYVWNEGRITVLRYCKREAMTAMGFDTGTFSPCLDHSNAADKSVFRHGHDFVVSGTRTQQKELKEQMSMHLIVKHLATLGPCTALGDITGVRILNRIVRWVKPPYGSGRERIEYAADQRHSELRADHREVCPRRVRNRNLELT